MKIEQQTCQICGAKLKLTRRQINEVTTAVRKVARDRYFVPDDEVFNIVHNVHSNLESLSTSETEVPTQQPEVL